MVCATDLFVNPQTSLLSGTMGKESVILPKSRPKPDYWPSREVKLPQYRKVQQDALNEYYDELARSAPSTDKLEGDV